jgi:hypothetical protein
MVGKFSFSFDRETFRGLHDTRQEALKKAVDKLPELDTSPEMIYVGKRVPVDPGSSGLAEMIIGAMRRRVRDTTGESTTQYLMHVNEHQLAELDDELDRVIRAWLQKHELTPTQSKVIAISEHPAPQSAGINGNGNGAVAAKQRGPSSSNEVSDLGETQYPISLL